MKKLFLFAAALLSSLSIMATDYEWATIPGLNFNSEDNAVKVHSASNLAYEQKQMASDDAKNKLYGIKVGSNANNNIDTAFVEISCTGTITALEMGVSNCSTNAGAVYSMLFSSEQQFDKDNIIAAVTDTSINRSVTSDQHRIIAVPTGAQSVRIYRKVKYNGTDYGAGTTVDIYYLKVTLGAPTVRYTVSYYDGENLLGTEKVEENGTPANYAKYQAKTHHTFDGWFNEAAFTSEADFTAAITADKAFYGKWTAEAFNASTSINIEQLVLDNGKGYDIATALTDAHITFANIDVLDSLNDTKTARNEPYLGLKVKKNTGYLEIGVASGSTLRVKFGNISCAVNVSGGETASIATDAEKVYEFTATENCYVRFTPSADAKTVVFKQIKINEAISEVTLPDSPTTSLDLFNAEQRAVKRIVNGQLLIEHNGQIFNALGQKF